MTKQEIREKTIEWVAKMSEYPTDMVETCMCADPESWYEVTEPQVGDRVLVYDGKLAGYGEISLRSGNLYMVEPDASDDEEGALLRREEFDVIRDSKLPMWGVMWSFGKILDEVWLEDGGLRKMSDCGFRIFEHDDWGYFFGINGGGYNFWDEHWIPLYLAIYGDK